MFLWYFLSFPCLNMSCCYTLSSGLLFLPQRILAFTLPSTSPSWPWCICIACFCFSIIVRLLWLCDFALACFHFVPSSTLLLSWHILFCAFFDIIAAFGVFYLKLCLVVLFLPQHILLYAFVGNIFSTQHILLYAFFGNVFSAQHILLYVFFPSIQGRRNVFW